MKTTWGEVRRELRWLVYSSVVLGMTLAAVAVCVLAALNLHSGVRDVVSQFSVSLEDFIADGGNLEMALDEPVVVHEVGGVTSIENSIRYEYENASFALSSLAPAPAAAGVLSLFCLLGAPVFGLVLGVLSATHDIVSRTILVRWPQMTQARFLGSAGISMLLVSALMAGIVGLGGLLAGWFLSTKAGSIAEGTDVVPASVEPSVNLLSLMGFAAAAMWLFALVGFAAASWVRSRSLWLTLFVAGFFVVPLWHEWDPRNLVLVVGQSVLFFPGSFQPAVIGDASKLAGMTGALVVAVVAMAVATLAWRSRSRFVG